MRDELMKVLREGQSTSWVADQIEHTLAQGVSMTVKDTKGDAEFFRLEPSDLTPKDRQKRQTYETTRTYTDQETETLIKEALYTVFVVLPAVQNAAISELQALDLNFDSIEFAVPDEPGREDIPHTLETPRKFSESEARERVDKFLAAVRQ